MLKRSILLAIAYWMIMTGAVCAAGVTITVAGQAKIDGPFVLLGNLADIQGVDNQRTRYWREIQLAPAPPLGSSQVWSREYLATRLAASGVDFENAAWQIPDSITLVSVAQTVRGSLIQERAVAAVKSQISSAAAGDEIEVAVVGEVGDLLAPPGDVEIRIELSAPLHYNGVNAVRAVVWINGQPTVIKTYVKMEIRLFRPIVVANRVIMAGQVIRPEDLRLERTDVGRMNGYYLDSSKFEGLAAKRIINPGTVMTTNLLEKPLLVRRGSPVNIVARVAGMEIVTAGQAAQDGRVGQLIRVMNMNSKKLVTGRVIDANTVQVITPGSSQRQAGEGD
ncbi:flagellar basal body P-ring formation chaperone FlgA [Azotosporobacter soli]|uniref:flagellar basal body P-ring formation chaperone FlgA n=1 Tax=Azotosporobacter soli TaxID=3055040 RepID=UPI0031FE7050